MNYQVFIPTAVSASSLFAQSIQSFQIFVASLFTPSVAHLSRIDRVIIEY